MKEKAPWSHEVVCFQMLDFETKNSKSEVSRTTFTSEGAVSHNVYTTNSSPLLVTK